MKKCLLCEYRFGCSHPEDYDQVLNECKTFKGMVLSFSCIKAGLRQSKDNSLVISLEIPANQTEMMKNYLQLEDKDSLLITMELIDPNEISPSLFDFKIQEKQGNAKEIEDF